MTSLKFAACSAFLHLAVYASGAAAQSGGWLDVREPSEWSMVCRAQGAITVCTEHSQPAVFRGNALVRLRGQALHPAGIQDIAVGGARAILSHLPDGRVQFSHDFVARPGLVDVDVLVRPNHGDPDRYTFHLQVEAVGDGLRGAWKAPETMLLIEGMPDTIRVAVAATGVPVPSHLITWESSNPDAVVVDSEGIVYPQREGTARVTASSPQLGRDIGIDLLVYPRLVDLRFQPRDTVITVVEGERFSIRADLHFSETRVLHNQVPKLTADSVRLRAHPGGTFEALIPGSSHIDAAVGYHRRRWRVEVVSPLVAIRQLGGYAVLLGDSVSLQARLLSPDSILVTTPTDGLVWRSGNPSVLAVRGAQAHARAVGRAEVTASRNEASDARSFFVLGDLLVGVRHGRRDQIATVSFSSNVAFPIGPDSLAARSPALSPDGSQIAFSGQTGRRWRLFLMDADGTNVRRVVPDQHSLLRTSTYDELSPAWSQDGRRILFVSNSVGNYSIFSIRPDGTELTRLSNSSSPELNPSSTGSYVAFDRGAGAGDTDVVIGTLDGTSESLVQVAGGAGLVRVKESKPVLVQGGTRLLFARGAAGLDPQAGEALTLFDLTARVVLRDLVPPLRNHELVFAVSPDGDRVAFHQRALWGRKNTRITVIDMNGLQLHSVALHGVADITDIGWAASPDRK